jgi:hypothetical protein
MSSPTLPAPWRLVADVAVGGLHSIGFVPQTEELLVVSQQGRGLVSAVTGARVARDPDASWSWFDERRGTALGLGAHERIWVVVSGLADGTLPQTTGDGWSLSVGAGDRLCLAPPGGVAVDFAPHWEGEPLRGFGFSDSGMSIAVGVGGHTVELYGRGIIDGDG